MTTNKICMECGVEFHQPPSLARIKFCSRKCYHENRRKWKYSDELKKKISDGVKKSLPSTAIKPGQHLSPDTEFKKGEDNLRWIDGRRAYREIIKRSGREEICEVCGFSEDNARLIIHHDDEDRHNNSLDNLHIMCNSCHQKLHYARRRKKE